MQNNIVFLFLIFITIFFSSCATITYADLNLDKSVKVYMHNCPEKEFEEVCYIEAFGSVGASKKLLLRKLQQKAKERGCNAMIEVKFNDVINVYPVATCIGIKE